jgi:WD40 repeat protein
MTREGPSPYVGLRAFESDEWDRFFARERWTRIVSGNAVASRLTLLYGESGVGKTSLLQAGVEHELRLKLTPVVFKSWQGDPVRPLIESLAPGVDGAEPPARLADSIRQLAGATGSRVVLILDQFEEYLLYHGGQEGANSLPGQLAQVLDEPRLPASVLLSIREDALSKLDPLKRAIPRLFDNMLHLEAVGRDAAEETITGPLAWYNAQRPDDAPVEIEPALVDAVLQQVSEAPSAADGHGETVEFAYLQLVLDRLWQEARADGVSRLTLELLERLPGGAEEIMRDHVRAAVDGLASRERDLAAEAFRYLVTPSGGKYAYTVADLAGQTGGTADELEKLAGELSSADARILRPVGVLGSEGVAPGVEIYHDKLADPILAWRAEHEMHRAAERAAAREREAARRRRWRQRAIAIGVVAALAIAALGALTFQQRRDASEQASLRLAADAAAQLDNDPQASIALALRAVRERATGAATEALRTALVESHVRRVFGRDPGPPFVRMAMTDDGRMLVSGDAIGNVEVSDTATGERVGELTRVVPGRAVSGVEIDRTGERYLATAGASIVVRSLAGDGAPFRWQPPGAPGNVVDADFSGDGRTVAVLHGGGRLALWYPDSGAVRTLGHVREPERVAVSPDGRRVLAAGGDGAQIWDGTTPTRLVSEPVSIAGFDDQGRRAFLAGGKRFWIWSGALGEPPLPIRGQSFGLTAYAFSPGGYRLATASRDQLARIWSTDNGKLVSVLGGHAAGINSIAYGPRGARIATASQDGTARVWVAVSGRTVRVLRGHAGPVQRAVLAEGRLATLSRVEGTVRLWEIDPARPLRRAARGPAGGARPGVEDFAPELELRSRRKDANRVEIREVNAKRPTALLVHEGVSDVEFSPDGTAVATSSRVDKTVRVWDSRTARALAILGEHVKPVRNVVFSPDGRFLLDVSHDGCARLWLWGAGDGALAARFPDEQCGTSIRIRAGGFSADGHDVLLRDARGRTYAWHCGVCGDASELEALAEKRLEAAGAP